VSLRVCEPQLACALVAARWLLVPVEQGPSTRDEMPSATTP